MAWIRWKKRNIFFIIILVSIFLLARVNKYEHVTKLLLHKTNAEDVWEYAADFNNLKYLNPTILDFNVMDESGDLQHWKYTIEYTQKLSYWPRIKNVGVANYEMISDLVHLNYLINATQRACFVSGMYCLESHSYFNFSYNYVRAETLCQELFTYQCPVMFRYFCRREVEYQRNTVMQKLRRKFALFP